MLHIGISVEKGPICTSKLSENNDQTMACRSRRDKVNTTTLTITLLELLQAI